MRSISSWLRRPLSFCEVRRFATRLRRTVIVICSLLPVPLSAAETFMMPGSQQSRRSESAPLASTSNVTSI